MPSFRDELKRGAWLVRRAWRKPVQTITPQELTDEEAKVAVRDYIAAHPGTYATDVADALRLPVLRACEVCDMLLASGEIEEGEV